MNKSFTEAEFAAEAMPHLNDLYRAAARLLMNRDEAEDLVQEVYLQAWKSYDRYEQGTNCKAWLFKILFHKLDHHRRRKFARAKFTTDSNDEMLTSVAYEPPVNHCLKDEEIIAALNRLPENYRAVILLADVEEFSYKEIAELLTIPIGTVMSRLSRARRQMRQLLVQTAPNFTFNQQSGKNSVGYLASSSFQFALAN